jgi:hypothetical protein
MPARYPSTGGNFKLTHYLEVRGAGEINPVIGEHLGQAAPALIGARALGLAPEPGMLVYFLQPLVWKHNDANASSLFLSRPVVLQM